MSERFERLDRQCRLSRWPGDWLLGLVSHFGICVLAAALCHAMLRYVPKRWSHPITGGIVFGIGFFVVMNYVVVPLSAAGQSPPRGYFWWSGLAVHALLIGPAIVAIVRTPIARRTTDSSRA